jgi:hypothetical protein
MVYETQKACPRFEGGMLVGGAILSAFTGRPINDFDIYFKSKEHFCAAVEEAYGTQWWCVHHTDRAVTFVKGDLTMQMMLFEWFPTASQVFDAFDFTCCMGALDFDAERLGFEPIILHEDFLPAAAARRLTFHGGTRFPIASAMRVIKYRERGYEISRQDTLALAIACAGVELNSWEALRRHIGGAYGHKVEIAESGEFSIQAAIAAIQSAVIVEGGVESSPPEYMSEPETLLIHLGLLEKVEVAA